MPRILLVLFSLVVVSTSPSEEFAVVSDQTKVEEQYALQLDDCVAIAIRNQPVLRIKNEDTHIAREQVDVARSYYFPQVDANARFTNIDQVRSFDIEGFFDGPVGDVFSDAAAFFQIARQLNSTAALNALDNPTTPIFPGGPTFESVKQQAAGTVPDRIRVPVLGEAFLNTQVRLVQPLWTAGRIRFRVDQARYGVKFARLAETRTRQEVEFNVTRAYLAVLLSRHLRTIVEDAQEKTDFLLDATRDLVEGQGSKQLTQAEVYQVESADRFFKSQMPRLRAAELRAVAALYLAMGLSQASGLEVANEQLGFFQDVGTVDEAIATGLSHRPEVHQAAVGTRVAGLEYRLAKAEFFPEVVAFGQFTSIHDDRNFANPNDSSEWAGGVAASIDISTGGRRKAEKRLATHKATKARATLQQVKLLVEQQVRDAFLELEGARDTAYVGQDVIDSVEKTLLWLDKKETHRVVAIDDRLHFLNKVNTIVLESKVKTEYYQSLFAYNLAIARLRLATGYSDAFDYQPLPDLHSDRNINAAQ